MNDMITAVVSAFWIVGSIASWFAIIGLCVWVIGWGARFRFWQTEIGLNIWLFSALLLLLVTNNVIGSVGASLREWWEPAPNDFIWWYFTRFAINVGILMTIVRMLKTLVRHWRNRESISIEVPARTHKPKTGSTPVVPGDPDKV